MPAGRRCRKPTSYPPVGLEGDQAVLGDVPDGTFLDDVSWTALRIEEKSFFLGKHLRRLPVGRAVDPLVGHSHDPLHKTGVEMIEALEALTPEEPFDVLDARLDLALGLGPVGPMRPRLEAVMSAEVPEDRVPFEPRPGEVPAQDDRPQVVVDDFMGDAAQVGEGGFVASKEGRELLVQRGLGIEPPVVAQRQDEKMDPSAPARDRRPALAPVGLALAPRRRLEPHRGLLECLGPQRADEPPNDVIAPLVTLAPDLLVDRLGAIADRRHPVPDPVLEARQKRTPLANPLIRSRRLLAKHFADRTHIQAQGSSYRLLPFLELPTAVDLVPYVGLHHALSSRSLDRKQAYPAVVHDVTPSERGHFSTPIRGHYCTLADT